MFMEGVEQVLGVAFANVFNPEVVNYKSENNWAPFVELESWSCEFFVVTGFVKTDVETII